MTETMATTLVVYWLAHIATVRERPAGSAAPLHKLVWHAAQAWQPGAAGPFGYEKGASSGISPSGWRIPPGG